MNHLSSGPTMNLSIKIKRTRQDARLPIYATEGAACFDLHACLGSAPQGLSELQPYGAGLVSIGPGESETFDTGLAFEIPPGHALLIQSRSGHGFKNGVRLANCQGIVASDFRDSVKIRLHNDSDEMFSVLGGDRIAQAMVMPLPRCSFEEVDQLTETARGTDGFGSTWT